MSTLVWGIEWKVALARKRDLALCVVTPLAIVLVVATGAVPVGARPAVYTALFAGCGVVRTAFPVLRDGERGMVLRVLRGGVSPASYLLQRAAAGATMSFVQLLPALFVAVAFLGASAPEALLVLGAFALTLWIVSVLGVLAAAASRSPTEAAALCLVGVLLLLHMSGTLHAPAPGGYGALLEGVSPFRALHEALAALVSNGGVRGVASGAVWAVALPGLVAASAPWLTRALQR